MSLWTSGTTAGRSGTPVASTRRGWARVRRRDVPLNGRRAAGRVVRPRRFRQAHRPKSTDLSNPKALIVGILIERNSVHDHTKRAPLPGTRSNRTPTAWPRHRVHRRLGRRGRREGRLRVVHAQGDRRAADAVADTLLGRLAAGRAGPRRGPAVRPGPPRHRKVFIVACGTAYHAGLIAKYAIEHWTRIPVEVEMASEFRYRDPVLDRSTLVVAISQSGETMDTLMALRHAKEQKARCWRSATPTARPSRASPTPCSTPTPARRSRSPRPRRSSTQLVACYLVGLFLAQVRGTSTRTRSPRSSPTCAGCPRRRRRCSRDGAGARAGPRAGRREHGALPRPARRLPGGAGGRAQAQGARLHPRRGLRGRRAQARPDRADRPGHAGRRRRPVAAQPRSRCTARWSPTSRRSGPAAPAPS